MYCARMKAVVYRGEQDVRVEDVAEPTIQGFDDAVVKVSRTAICGSDLHFFHGRVPGVFEGTVVGHEFVGEVVATGSAVTRFQVGDEVVGSFQIACGSCVACLAGRFNHCADLMVLGYGIFLGDLAGAQAEYVRIPHADTNLHAVPDGLTGEQALFAGDILTTGWYAARLGDIEPGMTVAVIGAGPVGTFAQMAAHAMGAGQVLAVDMVASRLELAATLGSVPINNAERSASVAMDEYAPGGADVVIETVGLVPALVTAIDCVKPGGTISVIGVHTEFEVGLPLANLFTRNITLRFGGSCNVQGVWDDALAAIAAGQADPTVIISHRLPLADAAEGYRLFDAKEAMKVVLEP